MTLIFCQTDYKTDDLFAWLEATARTTLVKNP